MAEVACVLAGHRHRRRADRLDRRHTGQQDKDGKSLAGDFDAQTYQTFRNIEATLQEAGATLGAVSADLFGRKRTIITAAAVAILLSTAFPLSHDIVLTAAIGFLLTIPIYVLVAALFAVYIPELFPTELRLRGVGISNAAGRSASIVVPLLIAPILAQHGVAGVLALMGVALVLLIVVFAWLGIEPERKSIEAVAVAPA